MALSAAVGRSFALQARDAGAQASKSALDRLRGKEPAFAFVFASNEYDAYQVLSGVAAQLPNTPALTLSTTGEFADTSIAKRSVSVALLAQGEIEIRTELISGSSPDIQTTLKEKFNALDIGSSQHAGLFLSFDGLHVEAEQLSRSLPLGTYQLAGWLAASSLETKTNAQNFEPPRLSMDGITAAFMAGEFRIGIGADHGWQPVGAYFEVTMAQGHWIRSLDGRPASERYAELFGYAAEEWSVAPLNRLVRLYPLGIERQGQAYLQVRTPRRVEPDGSLHMTASVNQGSVAHLMVGTASQCRDAARRAARQALQNLQGARPVLAIVVADASWQMLFESQPGSELEAIREELGADVPLAGGYNFGQIARLPGLEQPGFLNQHIQVVLFGQT